MIQNPYKRLALPQRRPRYSTKQYTNTSFQTDSSPNNDQLQSSFMKNFYKENSLFLENNLSTNANTNKNKTSSKTSTICNPTFINGFLETRNAFYKNCLNERLGLKTEGQCPESDANNQSYISKDNFYQVQSKRQSSMNEPVRQRTTHNPLLSKT